MGGGLRDSHRGHIEPHLHHLILLVDLEKAHASIESDGPAISWIDEQTEKVGTIVPDKDDSLLDQALSNPLHSITKRLELVFCRSRMLIFQVDNTA
jgi:hypothetical protein